MKSAFGQKLFRLFLLFALIPAVILVAVGYYLASQENPAALSSQPRQIAELANYYNHHLFERIDSGLKTWDSSKSNPTGVLDFVLRLDDTTCRVLASDTTLSQQTADMLARTAQAKPRGFTLIDSLFYQYSAVPDTSHGLLIGGVVHGQLYTKLADAIQSDVSSVSSRRVLTTKYLLFLALLFVVLALVTGLLAYYFSARMSRSLAYPLTRLSEASRAIAAGDFEQQVDEKGIGEIRTLIENFNLMARQLRTTTERLAQTERVAAWRTVARRFAHELKNPLQPILVSIFRLENALKDTPQYETVKQPLRAASEELKHLTELADRFSQLAKLPEPKIRPTNLNEFLNSIADLYADRLHEYDFTLELPPDEIIANLDETYFREVIHNLLQNAIEASDAGGRITLRLTGEHSSARITIEDSGRGMDKETTLAARMPYFTTKTGGSGIGLAMVDKIVNELGGSVSIDSEPGKGTKITVNIPAGADHD